MRNEEYEGAFELRHARERPDYTSIQVIDKVKTMAGIKPSCARNMPVSWIKLGTRKIFLQRPMYLKSVEPPGLCDGPYLCGKQVLKYGAGKGKRDSADNDREDRRRRRGPQILRWGQVARTNVIGSFTLSKCPQNPQSGENRLKPLVLPILRKSVYCTCLSYLRTDPKIRSETMLDNANIFKWRRAWTASTTWAEIPIHFNGTRLHAFILSYGPDPLIISMHARILRCKGR